MNPTPVNMNPDPVSMNPDPVNMNPDPVNMNPDPVNMKPDPQEGYQICDPYGSEQVLSRLRGLLQLEFSFFYSVFSWTEDPDAEDFFNESIIP